jgi:hypothetical protein
VTAREETRLEMRKAEKARTESESELASSSSDLLDCELSFNCHTLDEGKCSKSDKHNAVMLASSKELEDKFCEDQT